MDRGNLLCLAKGWICEKLRFSAKICLLGVSPGPKLESVFLFLFFGGVLTTKVVVVL